MASRRECGRPSRASLPARRRLAARQYHPPVAELATSVPWILGALLACGLIWVVWWAIFGDRRRDLRRCPRCWHDLSGTPGLICGECGYAARGEPQLHKPRRRWRVAGVAMLALVAAATTIRWHSNDASWTLTAPNWFLLAILPWSDGDRGDVVGELAVRLNMNELDEAELESLFARCMQGDGDGGPPSAAWARRYGPYLQWWRRPGFGTDSQRSRLEALPAAVTMRAPPIWLLDAPTCVHLQVDDWWPLGTSCRVSIRPLVEGAQEIVTVRTIGERIRSPFPFLVPAPASGAATMEIEVTIERRLEPQEPAAGDVPAGAAPEPVERAERPWTLVQRSVASLPVGDRRLVADAMIPVDSDTMTTAISDAFSSGLTRWATGRRRFGVRFNTSALRGSEFADMAIGLRVEALESGVPRRVLNIWWNADPSEPGPTAWQIVHEDSEALDRLRSGDPNWTLRVTGSPELALRALALRALALRDRGGGGASADKRTSPPKFWAGSFVNPLNVVDRPEPAPPRAWTPDVGPSRTSP